MKRKAKQTAQDSFFVVASRKTHEDERFIRELTAALPEGLHKYRAVLAAQVNTIRRQRRYWSAFKRKHSSAAKLPAPPRKATAKRLCKLIDELWVRLNEWYEHPYVMVEALRDRSPELRRFFAEQNLIDEEIDQALAGRHLTSFLLALYGQRISIQMMDAGFVRPSGRPSDCGVTALTRVVRDACESAGVNSSVYRAAHAASLEALGIDPKNHRRSP